MSKKNMYIQNYPVKKSPLTNLFLAMSELALFKICYLTILTHLLLRRILRIFRFQVKEIIDLLSVDKVQNCLQTHFFKIPQMMSVTVRLLKAKLFIIILKILHQTL